MATTTRALARRRMPDVGSVALGLVAVAVTLLVVAAATNLLDASERWGLALRVLAAVAGVGLLARGRQAVVDRERSVRGWILVSAGFWLAAEVARLVASGLASSQVPSADVATLIVLAGMMLAAAGSFGAAVRRRMPLAEEVAVHLDAITVFAGCAAVTIVLGGSFARDAGATAVLFSSAILVGTLGATVVLALATRVPPARDTHWLMVPGLTLLAVGYVGLLLPGAAGMLRVPLHAAVAAGTAVACWGGAAWTARESDDVRYVAISRWLRDALPMAAVAVAPPLILAVALMPGMLPEQVRLPAAATLALSTFAAIARQTLLVRHRGQAMERERRLLDELRVAETQYRSLVERLPGAVYVAEVGEVGRWHFVSPKIEELLGWSAEEWLADPKLWERSLHPADRDRMLLAEGATFEPGYNGSQFEYRLVARDGHTVWVLDDEEVIARDEDGRPRAVQGILLDLGDRKRLEEQLRHQALHDPLTGLPNRVLFTDRVTHALTRRDAGLDTAVLFLDIDDFKTVNDSLGHAAGDEILVKVAERLLAVLRTEDTACRLGGDEFAVLIEDAGPPAAAGAAERILAALRPPFSVDGRELTLRGSIGVAMRHDAKGAAEDLLRNADTAMYAAKALGKDRAALFEPGMEQPVRRRLAVRNALESALDRNEMFLQYQPMIDLASNRLIGVEALARWRSPQLGDVPPTEFIPLAEEAGLISRLGGWVLEVACAAMVDASVVGASGRRHARTRVSVNVSPHQVGDGQLQRQVTDVLERTGLDPRRLMLELTESSLAAAGLGTEAELRALRDLGVSVALDDFGAGYSSLEYLGRLPVDVLKVDRSLVERIVEEPQRREVLRAIAHIADQLGLETIAEGVERPEQRALLTEIGFHHAQGFLFSQPVDLRLALAYGRRGRRRSAAA
jgi:diguanylate cyclase (GGDEF)-like protein/PAS domain S-box-containing protein